MARSSRRLALGLVLTMLAPRVAMASPEPPSPPIQRPPSLSGSGPSEAEPEAPPAEAPAPAEPADEGAVAPPEGGESAPAVSPEDGAVPPAEAPVGEAASPGASPADGVPAAEPVTPVEVLPASDPAEPPALPEATGADERLTVVGADGQPVELTPSPPLKRPFPGSGQITGGSVLIGLGVLTMATGIIILSAGRDYPGVQVGGAIVLAIGVGTAGGGAGLVYEGTRNRKEFLAWRRQSGHQIPAPGNGMIVGGSILTGLGLLTIPSRPGLAVGELVAGGVLMGVGIHQHIKFKRTLKGHGLSLRPTFDGRQRTAGLSLSGRF